MKLQLSGGAYQARSVIASAQRCLNLVAEPMPQIQGEPAQFAYYPTPGLTTVLTLPQNVVRGIRQASNYVIYAVAGSGVYRITTGSTWSSTHLGDITAPAAGDNPLRRLRRSLSPAIFLLGTS